MSTKTTPRIQVTQSPIFYNKKWGVKESIVLSGKVIGDGYSDLLGAQASILSDYELVRGAGFSEGGIVRDNAFLTSVSFGNSDYLSNTDYSASFTSYPDDYFEEAGILDPKNDWDYSEGEDGIMTITHTVSAKGVNSGAFDTAKTFVTGLSSPSAGASSMFNETSLRSVGAEEVVLKSVSESSNRVEGTYSVKKVYMQDFYGTVGAIVRYSISTNEPVNGFYSADISGSVEGQLDADFSVTQTAFKGLGLYTIMEAATGFDLNETPISKSKVEDSNKNIITFDASFDDMTTNTGIDSVSLSLNVEKTTGQDGVVNYGLSGEVSGRLDLETKWADIESYYESDVDIFKSENLTSLFSDYFDLEVNPVPTSTSVTKNKFKGVISFSANLNNKPAPPSGLEEFEYSISMTLPAQEVTSYALVGKTHLLEDSTESYMLQTLGYFKKGKVSISGFGIGDDLSDIDSIKSIIDGEITSISSDYLKGDYLLVERNLKSSPTFGKKVDFSYSWEHDESPINSEDGLNDIFIL